MVDPAQLGLRTLIYYRYKTAYVRAVPRVAPLRVNYHLITLNEFNGQITKFLKVSNLPYVVVNENNEKKVYDLWGKEVSDILIPKSEYCRNTLSKRTLDVSNLRCVCGNKVYSWFHYKGTKRYIAEHDLRNGKTFYTTPIFNSSIILKLEVLCISLNNFNFALLIPYPFEESHVNAGIDPSIMWNGRLIPVKGLGRLVVNFEGATSYEDLAAFWNGSEMSVVRLGCSNNVFTITKKWNVILDNNILDVVFWDIDTILVLIPNELHIISLRTSKTIIRGDLKPGDAKLMEVNDKSLYLASSNRLYHLEALPAKITLKKRSIASIRAVQNGD